ncbi:Arabinolytic transcriptional activator araR [Cytospora mali]|uniref:Arabinolytic transcriptional activator araR n=1 Tax=Cytospora mali TaxID=578113 RepID=A0A194V8F7_CYTMA|nr:Arabinolytic transcriptional activator araR [Valsa mali var. pyri (nom. inval.)]
MSQLPANPVPGREQTAMPPTKTKRVLACVLCQQRKVKCDRKFPCANCIRASVQCVQAHTLTPRQRRRRFPERELLERLRHYEDLLHQNDIEFEPLHSSTPASVAANAASTEHSSPGEDNMCHSPRSLSCMLAVAIRMAKRIGIHSQSAYTGCTALEAESRRRLWWSLVIFDHRISEMSDYKTTSLEPTWDCRPPLNINDFELQPDTKTTPAIHERPTEAIFAVVRSELADFVRHSTFHINFINPSLKAVARPKGPQNGPLPEGGELMALERTVEDKYFAIFNADDPIHYMTIWTARGFLARNRLLEHYSRHSTSSVRPTDAQRGAALSYAVSMLECDTKLRSSHLTKKFLWTINAYFPALAYLHILIVLGKRPAEDHAEKAWEAVSNNYEVLVSCQKQQTGDEKGGVGIFFASYTRAILQAWGAREALLRQQRKPPESPPRIVLDVRNRMMQTESSFLSEQSTGDQPTNGALSVNEDNSSAMATALMDMDGNVATEDPQSFTGLGPAGCYPDILGQDMTDVNTGQFWTEIDWRWMHTQGW